MKGLGGVFSSTVYYTRFRFRNFTGLFSSIGLHYIFFVTHENSIRFDIFAVRQTIVVRW